MTNNEKKLLAPVLVETWAGRWYRAQDHGERVTLAALYRKRLFDRRPWRGIEGERDTAYEYQAGAALLEAAREKGLGPPAPRSKP